MYSLGFTLSDLASYSVNVVYLLLVVSTIIVIVLDNRNPVKTIAWVLVLMFLPLVGLVVYFFFGRTQRKEKLIGRRTYNKLQKLPVAEYLSQEKIELPEEYSRLVSLLVNTDRAYPFSGNDVTVYTDGYSWLQALLREMAKAREHIHVESFIFNDDAVGRIVSDMLIQKVGEGVEVRVIYDDVGCWNVRNSFFDHMKANGVEVESFLKVRFPLFTDKVNYRNHRKSVVIDGRVGFIGGMNIANRYVKGVEWGVWRDTQIRIVGKAVHGLQTDFLLDWYFVQQSLLASPRFFPKLGEYGTCITQIVTSTPVYPGQEIMQGLIKIISTARKYVYMQTPYFMPTDTFLSAMKIAAMSGVDVRLMIPERSDSRVTSLASESFLSDVLACGVKVYLYRKGFLHSKLMVCDDELCSIGSSNIDFRSFEHDFEINAFNYDRDLAVRVRNIFLADQRESVQLNMKSWGKRPWYRKSAESVVRLIAPLL